MNGDVIQSDLTVDGLKLRRTDSGTCGPYPLAKTGVARRAVAAARAVAARLKLMNMSGAARVRFIGCIPAVGRGARDGV